MARRHLRELLSEEQEPFVLKSYIDERRCQLRPPVPRTHPQPKRRASISQNHAVPLTPPKSPLFNTFPGSSYVKRSPLFDLTTKNPSVPSRTVAYLLLEAALRIPRGKQQKKRKPAGAIKGLGLWFFSSVLKRLAQRKRRCEIGADDIKVSVKDILRWDPFHAGDCRKTQKTAQQVERNSPLEMGLSGYSYRREEVGRKEMKAKVSSHPDEMDSVKNNGVGSGPNEKGFISSPSPVRPIQSQPEFGSPACSPHRQKTKRQLFGGTGEDGVKAEKEECDEEQEKEQLSPVSVLDGLFHEEEDEDHQEGHVEESCHQSLALVQRAKQKQQVLRQIRLFEKLGWLDPIELDKLLAAEQSECNISDNDYHDDDGDVEQVRDCNEPEDDDDLSYVELSKGKIKANSGDLDKEEITELIREFVGLQSDCPCIRKISAAMQRLVLGIVEEERGEITAMSDNVEELAERVYWRFEAWKEVSSNTINMMVNSDFKQAGERSKRCREEVQDFAAQIASTVFDILLCELCDEQVRI